MKLSELVAFRSALEQFNFYRDSRLLIKTILEAKAHVDDKVNTGTNQQIKFGAGVYQDELDRDILRLEESISELGENFEYYKKQLNDIVLEKQEEYIKESETMYIRDELPNARESAKERQLTMDDENTDKFFDRITQLSDWRYPGMIINCQEQKIINEMASSDPLYLADMNISTLDNIRGKMNNVYKHRVRPYVIDRYLPRKKHFGDLPNNQFGLIVVWNTLNNLPLSMCEQALSQMFDLLRPGGTVLFTFNDCDNAHNIRNFENNFRQFTPGSLLVPIVEKLGYTVRFRTETIHGWMELKKSGKLKTIRGGQSLAQVIQTDKITIDLKKTYTREEQDMIINEAIALGIDKEEVIRQGAISIGKLELLIKRRKNAIIEERKLTQLANTIEWKATNQGYLKGQRVKHGKRVWEAVTDIKPKQRFDEAEWRLVE